MDGHSSHSIALCCGTQGRYGNGTVHTGLSVLTVIVVLSSRLLLIPVDSKLRYSQLNSLVQVIDYCRDERATTGDLVA